MSELHEVSSKAKLFEGEVLKITIARRNRSSKLSADLGKLTERSNYKIARERNDETEMFLRLHIQTGNLLQIFRNFNEILNHLLSSERQTYVNQIIADYLNVVCPFH